MRYSIFYSTGKACAFTNVILFEAFSLSTFWKKSHVNFGGRSPKLTRLQAARTTVFENSAVSYSQKPRELRLHVTEVRVIARQATSTSSEPPSVFHATRTRNPASSSFVLSRLCGRVTVTSKTIFKPLERADREKALFRCCHNIYLFKVLAYNEWVKAPCVLILLWGNCVDVTGKFHCTSLLSQEDTVEVDPCFLRVSIHSRSFSHVKERCSSTVDFFFKVFGVSCVLSRNFFLSVFLRQNTPPYLATC